MSQDERQQRLTELEDKGAGSPPTKMDLLYQFAMGELYDVMARLDSYKQQQVELEQFVGELLETIKSEQTRLKELYRVIYENVEKHGQRQLPLLDEHLASKADQVDKHSKIILEKMATMALAQSKSCQSMLNDTHQRLIKEQSDINEVQLVKVLNGWQKDQEIRQRKSKLYEYLMTIGVAFISAVMGATFVVLVG